MAEEKKPEPLREQLRKLAGEIEHLRKDLGIDLEEVRAHIATLTTRVEERIRPAEVEEIRRMVEEIRTFHEGLLLPWRREISEELETRALWAERIARGETELTNRIEGKYAIYESYHHLPTCETWVKSTPIPYR